jgi:hypothetical protein
MLYYREHAFLFDRFPGELLDGRLLLDAKQKELLTRLVEGEDERWYLDEAGKRLSSDQLFARSPWSWQSSEGTVKLLCRTLNLRDGRASFSAPTSYLEGGLYDWMQSQQFPNQSGSR